MKHNKNITMKKKTDKSIEPTETTGLLGNDETDHSKTIMYMETKNIIMFKKLSFLSKSFFSKKIKFQFTKDRIVLSMTNHQKVSEIIAIFDSKNTESFYCKESTTIYISSSEFEIIFNKIDNNYKKVKIEYKKSMKDKRIFMYLETVDNLIEFHNIELSNISFNKVQIYKEKNRELYPQMVVKYKILKKLITSIKNISSNFTLEVSKKKLSANVVSENRKILTKINIPIESYENVYEDTLHYVRLSIKDFKNLSILNCFDKITLYINKDDDFICLFDVHGDKIIYCISQYELAQ